jgi:hypothetical protein
VQVAIVLADFLSDRLGSNGAASARRSTSKAVRLCLALASVTVPGTAGFHSAAMALVLGDVPAGGGAGGKFGPVTAWPVIPIHMALLPDGRVLTWGASTADVGPAGYALSYDIWDPKTGTHTTLPNKTQTDIFCGQGTLFGELASGKTWVTGQMAIVGGDAAVNGVRNYSNNGANLLDPATNQLTSVGAMQFARWYPTVTTLPNGEKLLIGGRRDPNEFYGSLGPATEIFSQTHGWRTLSGINVNTGTIPRTQLRAEYNYPRIGFGKNSSAYLFTQAGVVYALSFAGAGVTVSAGIANLAESSYSYPMAQLPNPKADPSSPSYDPSASNFLHLLNRYDKKAVIVDLVSNPPKVAPAPDLKLKRVWGNLTVLADGKLLASGGSASDDPAIITNPALVTVPAKQAEIFDPSSGANGTWTLGASAQKLRLYHSAALLLPDGSVLTGGGGIPGPATNFDIEIFYPPYLYDAAGNPKPRPRIVGAPATIKYGKPFTFGIAAGDVIKNVRLVQLGAVTHSYNPDQHYYYVPFTQTGTSIVGQLTADPAIIPPGYYMLFVFNQAGTPSIAAIVSVPQLYN